MPIALSVRRMAAGCPIALRTCLIRTSPVVSSSLGVTFGPRVRCQTNVLGMGDLLRAGARLVPQRRDFDAALARDLLDRRELREAVHRRAHHVVRVRGAEALRENVG